MLWITSIICTALALHVHRQSRNNRRCYVAQGYICPPGCGCGRPLEHGEFN